MKSQTILAGLCLLLAPLTAAAEDVAEQLLERLERQDFAAAHTLFAAEIAAALDVDQLARTWQSLPEQLGEYRGRAGWRDETVAGHPLRVARLEFAAMALDARIGVDQAGRINGFQLVPATPAPPLAAAHSETELLVAGDLPALLTLPDGPGPFPAAILVHGSGPNDRDQTIGPNRSFRDLAHGLAERGVASLRWDKRPRVQPEAFVGQAFTVQQEVIDDAVAAMALLRGRSRIDPDRVAIVGHSLGAMLAPRIAARVEPRPVALVLLAAPARRLQRLIVEQVSYIVGIDGQIDADEAEQLSALRLAAAEADAAQDLNSAKSGLLGLPEAYLADLNAYDPVATARELQLPMLIVQGGRDYQVTVDGDFSIWQAAFESDPEVELTLFPDLDHLFRAGEGRATPASYLQQSVSFEPPVLDRIADFVGRLRQ